MYETPGGGSLIGTTAGCLIGEQFMSSFWIRPDVAVDYDLGCECPFPKPLENAAEILAAYFQQTGARYQINYFLCPVCHVKWCGICLLRKGKFFIHWGHPWGMTKDEIEKHGGTNCLIGPNLLDRANVETYELKRPYTELPIGYGPDWE